jgi:cytochrome b561
LARWLKTAPEILPIISRWQQLVAKAMHIALYILMICMPIASWLILSGEGKVISFWGINLPVLIADNKQLAETIEEVHETAGTVGYYLIGLHALAALFHHYVQRDNTLRHMFPRFNSTSGQ